MKRVAGWSVLATLVVLLAGAELGAEAEDRGTPLVQAPRTTQPERHLVQSLLDIRSGRLEAAMGRVTTLLRQQPDFELAHLVYGDMLMAMSGQWSHSGNGTPDEKLGGLWHEARARFERYAMAPPTAALPASLVQMPDHVRAALLVDLDQYRLYIFDNQDGRPVHRRDFYVSIGKAGSEKRYEGDEKTPVGVYVVNEYLPGTKLPDMYGEGAFPLNYPNRWDRAQGRTGSGIWIHGTESARYSRAPQSSLGCVTLSNTDFLELKQHVDVSRTPVIMTGDIEWLSPDEAEAVRESILGAVEQWRLDWESRDSDRYLSHYSSDFRSGRMDRRAFAAYKRSVNSSKKYIRVRLDDLGAYSYRDGADMAVVHFLQHYDSDSFKASARKTQYWRLEDGSWKIVAEARG